MRRQSRWRFYVIACILSQGIAVLRADTCVKYHKRASVFSVCGRMTNAAGERLADIEADLVDETGSVSFRTRSNSEGSFRFDSVPAGDFTLRIDAPAYQRAERQLRVTRTNSKHCGAPIEVRLGFNTCETGTYIKGIDKPSDLDEDKK